LRFSRHLRALPTVVRELAAKPVVLVLAELIVMVWLWVSPGLTDVETATTQLWLAAYAAFKVAALGAGFVAINRRSHLGVSVLGSLATLTGVAGIWAAFTGVSILLPVVGLLLVRGALVRSSRQPVAHFHFSTADALLAPALVLVVGDLVAPTTALVEAAPMALSLIIFSTSAAAIALVTSTSEDDQKCGVEPVGP
jgi:hypothetical protein